MKSGQGKRKGSEFERLTGRKISLWLTKGQRKDLICRTVLSGGQFTVTGGGNAGDLMAQHPLAFKFFEIFVLECKHWKNLDIIRFLAKDGDLYRALQKVKKEAEKKDKYFMLIARQNHQKVLVFMPTSAVARFLSNGVKLPSHHQLFNGELMMLYLDEFLSASNPEMWTGPV